MVAVPLAKMKGTESRWGAASASILLLLFTAGETASKKLQGLLKAMRLVSKRHLRTSLDVQCLGIHFPVQSHQIRSLIRELRSHTPAVQPEKKKSQTLPPELSSMLGMCAVMP